MPVTTTTTATTIAIAWRGSLQTVTAYLFRLSNLVRFPAQLSLKIGRSAVPSRLNQLGNSSVELALVRSSL